MGEVYRATATRAVLRPLRLFDLTANTTTGEIKLSWSDTGGPYLVEAAPA